MSTSLIYSCVWTKKNMFSTQILLNKLLLNEIFWVLCCKKTPVLINAFRFWTCLSLDSDTRIFKRWRHLCILCFSYCLCGYYFFSLYFSWCKDVFFNDSKLNSVNFPCFENCTPPFLCKLDLSIALFTLWCWKYHLLLLQTINGDCCVTYW